jgi:hypothetical protein
MLSAGPVRRAELPTAGRRNGLTRDALGRAKERIGAMSSREEFERGSRLERAGTRIHTGIGRHHRRQIDGIGGIDGRAFGRGRRAIYLPPIALHAYNIRTTVITGTGDRSPEPHGQQDDPTGRTVHRAQCLAGIPGSWVGWTSYLPREFNQGATLIGINRGDTGGTWPKLITKYCSATKPSRCLLEGTLRANSSIGKRFHPRQSPRTPSENVNSPPDSDLLGFDHTRLTYRYAGRDLRMIDVHGEVVRSILA